MASLANTEATKYTSFDRLATSWWSWATTGRGWRIPTECAAGYIHFCCRVVWTKWNALLWVWCRRGAPSRYLAGGVRSLDGVGGSTRPQSTSADCKMQNKIKIINELNNEHDMNLNEWMESEYGTEWCEWKLELEMVELGNQCCHLSMPTNWIWYFFYETCTIQCLNMLYLKIYKCELIC